MSAIQIELPDRVHERALAQKKSMSLDRLILVAAIHDFAFHDGD